MTRLPPRSTRPDTLFPYTTPFRSPKATMADIYFTGTGDEAADRKIRRDLAAGKLQRVAQGVYIDPGTETVEGVILRNWTKIAGHLVSDGVVTDRSGIEARPFRDTPDHVPILFMSAPRSRAKIKLPGLEIGIRQGAGPVAEDIPFLGTHLASEARRLLDNMTPSRARTGPARTLGPDVVEKRLDS